MASILFQNLRMPCTLPVSNRVDASSRQAKFCFRTSSTWSSNLSACCRSNVGSKPAAAVQEDADVSVNHRVRRISKQDELERELDAAGDRLVVLEVMSESECSSGLWEEPEDHWTPEDEQHERQMRECVGIRNAFVKLAASSMSARFLSVLEEDGKQSEIAKFLNISVFPAVVFFKNKQVVWQTEGAKGMASGTAEGVLYFGGKQYVATPAVMDLNSERDISEFVTARTQSTLKVVMASTHMCSPCIHVYPSFVSLATSFGDKIQFARLEGDDEDVKSAFEKYNILEVPTFLAYENGNEVARLVSGRRGDLIGFLLKIATERGLDPPPPR